MKVNPLLTRNSLLETCQEGQIMQLSEKESVEKILCNIRTN
jgi:hypothetical protein